MPAQGADNHGKSPDRESVNLKKLADCIILGSERIEAALDLLDYVEQLSDGMDRLMAYRDNDETLLHLAAKFHNNGVMVEKLISLCPKLLTATRSDKYEGQTALHIAISKENQEAVEVMVWHPEKHHLLSIPATGSRFPHTVMMGELPLSVAATTFNEDIVLELIHAGARTIAQNSYGDTVFHSLVKFSALHSGNEGNVILMMEILNNTLAKRSCDKIETIQNVPFEETDPVAIWLLANYEHLTPLQLAGKLGQVEVFNFILNLEGVYCRLDRHDGLFDINLYDITEIDGVAMQIWFIKNRKTKSTSKIFPQNTCSDIAEVNKNQTRFNRMADPKDFQSVLERISKIEVHKTFAFLLLPVIRSIIKDKWSLYRWYYYAWAVFHLTHMSMMMWYAIERTKLTNISTSQNSSQDSDVPITSRPSQVMENFVNVFTNFSILVPVLYLLFEFRRRLLQNQQFLLCKIHHNGTYRLLLILFSVTAITDAVWYKIQPGYDYFLIISILIGCWFLTFFLRAFKKFSFFTVMIQKIILSDLFRFSIIISLELVSFTAMIYLQFVTSKPPVPEFQTYRISLLTLFNLMLGLSDISILNDARDPWLAVSLFVTFALLTYVLMINALIAMMSQTCALVSSNKHTQWQLQRLSIILFTENTILPFMRKCCGQAKFVKHFDIKQKTMIQEERYFLEMDSLQMSYSKGEAILARRDLANTSRFGDVNALPLGFRQYSPNHSTRFKKNHGELQKQDQSQKLQKPSTQNVVQPQTSQNQFDSASQMSQMIALPDVFHHQQEPPGTRNHRYKKRKETDHFKVYRHSPKPQQRDDPPVFNASDITNTDPRRSAFDQMLTKPTCSKQLPHATDLMNDTQVSLVSTIQTSEPIKEVKVRLTDRTQSADVPTRESPATNSGLASPSEISRASKEKGGRHTRRRKSRSTVHTDVTDGNRRTASTDVSDKQDSYKHQEPREVILTDELNERKKSDESFEVNISTVYISS